MTERPATKIGRIERHPDVMGGASVIAGTRIPVRAIRDFAADGCSIDGIIKEYPSLKEEDVRAALSHQRGDVT